MGQMLPGSGIKPLRTQGLQKWVALSPTPPKHALFKNIFKLEVKHFVGGNLLLYFNFFFFFYLPSTHRRSNLE